MPLYPGLKDHIHLSTALDSGPEFAPDMKWKVRVDGWMYTPTVTVDTRRTLTGKLKKHVLRSGGVPVLFKEYKYVLKIDDYDGYNATQRLAALTEMQGKDVYLIDVIHTPLDGQNHSGDVLNMFVTIAADIQSINPQLLPLYIGVELKDDFTV
jgi:hypothetical protein